MIDRPWLVANSLLVAIFGLGAVVSSMPVMAATPEKIRDHARAGKCDKAGDVLQRHIDKHGTPDFDEAEWSSARRSMAECYLKGSEWEAAAAVGPPPDRVATPAANLWRYAYAAFGPESPLEVLCAGGKRSNGYVDVNWSRQRCQYLRDQDEAVREMVDGCLRAKAAGGYRGVQECIKEAEIPQAVLDAEAADAAERKRRQQEAAKAKQGMLDGIAAGEVEAGRCNDEMLGKLQENQRTAQMVFESMSRPYFKLEWSGPLVVGSAPIESRFRPTLEGSTTCMWLATAR
jgi:hypothetical protein